jgi:hypothetical protein
MRGRRQRGGWLFRFALQCYPAPFRERFGDEMRELFEARLARARTPISALALQWRLLVDTAQGAWRSRRPHPMGGPQPVRAAGRFGTELAHAARTVRRARGRALALAALVALTVAAATSVFAVVDATLLTPPPFRDHERVVAVWERRVDGRTDRDAVGGHEFPEWVARTTVFDALAAYVPSGSGTSLTGVGDPLALSGVRVTSRFFDVLGVTPILGRGFRPEEDEPGRGDVAVISHRLWVDRFGADPGVVGRPIRISDVPVTVVGIAPRGFAFPEGPPGVTPGS